MGRVVNHKLDRCLSTIVSFVASRRLDTFVVGEGVGGVGAVFIFDAIVARNYLAGI